MIVLMLTKICCSVKIGNKMIKIDQTNKKER